MDRARCSNDKESIDSASLRVLRQRRAGSLPLLCATFQHRGHPNEDCPALTLPSDVFLFEEQPNFSFPTNKIS